VSTNVVALHPGCFGTRSYVGSVPVLLTEWDRERAERWQQEIDATAMNQRPSATGIYHEGRYRIGWLGELAFLRWARSFGAVCHHSVATDGKPGHEPEFRVRRNGRTLLLDVKTRTSMPDALAVHEREKLDADVFVLAHIWDRSNRLVELVGWAYRDELASTPITPIPDFKNKPGHSLSRHALRDMRVLMLGLDPDDNPFDET